MMWTTWHRMMLALLTTSTFGGCATMKIDELNMQLDLAGGRPGEVTVQSRQILDTTRRKLVGPEELAAQLKVARVVYVGESHDSVGHHRTQHDIIAALSGGTQRWAIGLEMLPRSTQAVLDQWVRGELDEREFVRQVGWYDHWGYDYRLYRPIFQLARARKLPLVALNIAAALVRKVGRGGLDSLSTKEKESLPDVYLGSQAHRRVFTALLSAAYRGHARKERDRHNKGTNAKGTKEEQKRKHHHRAHTRGTMMERIYQAQSLWDEAMADTALRYLEQHPSDNLIVLAGSGHVVYGVGISMRLARRAPGISQRLVLPLIIEGRRRKFARQLAHFLVGLRPPGEERPLPSLGIVAERKGEALVIRSVRAKGAAAKAGLKPGDRLVSLDGAAIGSIFDLRWSLLDKKLGDTMRVKVSRAQRELELSVRLAR